MDESDNGLVVIGAGLMRTGTNSLKIALQRLLGGKCYHMYEVFENPKHASFWYNATKRNPSDQEWRTFLSNYKAAVDLPQVAFYKELMKVYPNAKVVLSVRDPERWFESVQSTIAFANISMKQFPMNIIARLTGMAPLVAMADATTDRIFGENHDLNNKERTLRSYHEHVAEVKRVVPPDRLLVFEARDGWDPLCDFLGVEVPAESYPHVNSKDEFIAKMNRMKRVRTISLALAPLVIASFGYFAYWIAKKLNVQLIVQELYNKNEL